MWETEEMPLWLTAHPGFQRVQAQFLASTLAAQTQFPDPTLSTQVQVPEPILNAQAQFSASTLKAHN